MKAALVRIMIITGLLLIFFAVFPPGCTVFPPSASQGKIAFISNRVELPGDKPGYFHLYVMNLDGSHQTRLTNGERRDYSLSWSPDGKKIVFGSTENGTSYIYIINADGTGETSLTNGPWTDSEPAWSPDGKKIIFISNRENYNRPMTILEIYVMNPDGTNQTRLTYNGYCAYPRWSPDGSRIIFTSSGNSTGGIYIIKADGTDRISILSNQEQENYDASYSPDGKKILFMSVRPGTPPIPLIQGMFVMNADGSNQVRLTDNMRDSAPSWSPDAKQIVFSSDRGSTKDNPIRQIYKMNLDGSGLTRITDTPALNDQPAWSRYPR